MHYTAHHQVNTPYYWCSEKTDLWTMATSLPHMELPHPTWWLARSHRAQAGNNSRITFRQTHNISVLGAYNLYRVGFLTQITANVNRGDLSCPFKVRNSKCRLPCKSERDYKMDMGHRGPTSFERYSATMYLSNLQYNAEAGDENRSVKILLYLTVLRQSH
jgi:hypothetical protein